MKSCWPNLVKGWNEYIGPSLDGRTHIYTFDDCVRSLRHETILYPYDCHGGGTDLCSAFIQMAQEIHECPEKYIRAFLVTDGEDTVRKMSIAEAFRRMKSPPSDKVVDVFVLGVGREFPVRYSIELRSRLHSGSANLPSLFWADGYDILKECLGIRIYCTSHRQSLELSEPGYRLPGSEAETRFFPDEYVYFPTSPEQVRKITITFCDSPPIRMDFNQRKIPHDVLMNVFRQWNGILIKLKATNKPLPPAPIEFMGRLFNATRTVSTDHQPPPLTIGQRLREQARQAKKMETGQQYEFQTIMNEVKAVLTEAAFGDEMQLAANILHSTVSGGKYETKALQRKGHTDEQFRKDTTNFLKIVEESKDALMSLEEEERCHITLTSTLDDIRDPDLGDLMKLNKFEFLKTFTISGIGVVAPMRDCMVMNPWSFSIKSILGFPYQVVSQVAMENYKSAPGGDYDDVDSAFGEFEDPDEFESQRPAAAAERHAEAAAVALKNKVVEMKPGNPSTGFNAIVPVFSPEVAKTMAPLVKTRLFAMCATFTLLKNPHIIDFNIHFAALGVTWAHLMLKHWLERSPQDCCGMPSAKPYPEYMQRQIWSIEATAALYLDREDFQRYWQMLQSQTHEALMTESLRQDEQGRAMAKCEALIKPMFILHLHLKKRGSQLDEAKVVSIMRLMMVEFIGRCVAYEGSATPFSDFFIDESWEKWVDDFFKDPSLATWLNHQMGSEDIYTEEDADKAARRIAEKRIGEMVRQGEVEMSPCIDATELTRLRNVPSAGDISVFTFFAFADEIGLPGARMREIFQDKSLLIYTVHALENRTSRMRLANPLPSYETAMKTIVARLPKEAKLRSRLECLLKETWLNTYREIHLPLVKPMSRDDIIEAVQSLHGEKAWVTEGTFDEVYPGYCPKRGLLRNACQIEKCKYFLQPSKRYNQHLFVERCEREDYIHGLHRALYEHRNDDFDVLIANLRAGTHSRSHYKVPEETIEPIKKSLAEMQLMYKERHSGHDVATPSRKQHVQIESLQKSLTKMRLCRSSSSGGGGGQSLRLRSSSSGGGQSLTKMRLRSSGGGGRQSLTKMRLRSSSEGRIPLKRRK